jgi:hypothetical protein
MPVKLPRLASRFASIRPPQCVSFRPYNSFDVITQNAVAWADRVRRERSAPPVILKPGEWFDIPPPVSPN